VSIEYSQRISWQFEYVSYFIFVVKRPYYVIFCDNERTTRVRYFAICWHYYNYDENKLCVSYLSQSSQKSVLNVSLILAKRKQ